MSRAANDPKLKNSFQTHLEETKEHVERLKQAFELLGAKAKAKPCRGMQGLVEDGQETIDEGKEKTDVAADLALAVAAQKVEHYEIAGYGSAGGSKPAGGRGGGNGTGVTDAQRIVWHETAIRVGS